MVINYLTVLVGQGSGSSLAGSIWCRVSCEAGVKILAAAVVT